MLLRARGVKSRGSWTLRSAWTLRRAALLTHLSQCSAEKGTGVAVRPSAPSCSRFDSSTTAQAEKISSPASSTSICSATLDLGDEPLACKASSLPAVQPAGSDIALRNLLRGRPAAILWDLDNVDFFAPACSAPLQVRRLRALVSEAGAQLVLCRAYGNLVTVQRLAGVLPLLEACGLLEVEPVAVRRDAADVRLVHDAMQFAATRGSVGAAVLCVSQDTDFAGPLRHLSERGVQTLAVSPHNPRRRTHFAMEPATYFRRLPLPTACWAALKWESVEAPVTGSEAAWLRDVVSGIGRGEGSGESRGMGEVAAAAGTAATAVNSVVPAGLVSYTWEGALCPGTATRLWLNPRFCGWPLGAPNASPVAHICGECNGVKRV